MRFLQRLIAARRYSTIDSAELEKFKAHSEDWWNSDNFKVLVSMNSIRVPYVRDGIIHTGFANEKYLETDKPLTGVKILDAGCGGGFLSEPLARLGAKVTGLDPADKLLEIAKEHMKMDPTITDNLKYVSQTIEDYAIDNKETYDAVVSSEVIEHVVNKKDFLQGCVDCLKPGGSFFLTTMSSTQLSRFVNIFVAECVLRMVPKGTHEFQKFVTPHQLQRLLEDCNCTTKRVHGFTVNPITLKWHWIPTTHLSYALHAIKNKPSPVAENSDDQSSQKE